MALDFNGTTQHLLRASTPITAVPITMFGRYRFDTALSEGQEAVVLSLTDHDAVQEFTIEVGRNGGVDSAIAMAYSGASGGYAISSASPTINTWENVCGVYSATNSRKVYLNGGSTGTDTTSLTPSGISHIYVGATSSASSIIKPFNGALADLAIWSIALNDSEIAALNKGLSPLLIRPTSLVFYAPIIRGLNDFRGGILTNVNTATAFAHPRLILPKGYNNDMVPSAVAASNLVKDIIDAESGFVPFARA